MSRLGTATSRRRFLAYDRTEHGMADAPGEPGQPPRWLPTGKDGVGRALRDDARVWFTLGRGILNEIAYPRVEQTAVRDFGLILTDGDTLFAEERRHCQAVTSTPDAGIPSYHVASRHDGGRFSLSKHIVADPHRPAILQHVAIEDHGGQDALPLRVHALLAPHLVNVTGMGSAWIGEYKGVPMLFAEAQGTAVALAASCGWRLRSAGYAGVSDGWQDLSRHRRMEWQYERAFNGNVALTGELDWTPGTDAQTGGVTLALGFGRIWTEAAMRARAALEQGFEAIAANYVADWRDWFDCMQQTGTAIGGRGSLTEADWRSSLMVLRSHECPSVDGARISSLGVPWAALQHDAYPAACHLVRARDVVAASHALFAAGDRTTVATALAYLRTVQEPDGHWPRNFWLDGMPAWQGLQLDETAQPILLADMARRHGLLDDGAIARCWPMLRDAALFLARHDPRAGLDRWGRTDGPSLHTIGTQLSALLAAADWAGHVKEPALALYFAETADGTREIMLASLNALAGDEPDPDVISLALLGLVSPKDPRLIAALAAIDATLRVELPGGPAWCRRGGIGRPPRPVLTAERGLLAVLSGRHDEALTLLDSLQHCAGEGGLLPERVDHESGRGGIVMPHLWTHAEHVGLLHAIYQKRPFDVPPHAAARYSDGGVHQPRIRRWRPDDAPESVAHGRALRLELPTPSEIHWSADHWTTVRDTPTTRLAEGLYITELPTMNLVPGTRIVFTWREINTDRWAGIDYHVEVIA
jgi:glucoamylase